MIIKQVVVGVCSANCYVVGCEKSREAIIIDPGGEPDKIRRIIEKAGLHPKIIVDTHGHFDHIGANGAFELPIYIHVMDKDMLSDPEKNGSVFYGKAYTSPPPDKLLQDGDHVEFGEVTLEVIHTPGHTPGCICLLGEGIVFTGDTLFAGGVGRTDLPGGSEVLLFESIREKLFSLPDATIIFPGHGPSSTIGKEKKYS